MFKSINLKTIQKLSLWLLGTYLALLIIALIIFLSTGSNSDDIQEFFPIIAKAILTNPIGWFLLIIPFSMKHLFTYLFNGWKNHTRVIFFKRFSFAVVLPALLLFSGFNISKWYTQSEDYQYTWDSSFDNDRDSINNRYQQDGKQRGMHFFGYRKLAGDAIQKLLQTNTEWVTIVPFGYQEDYDSERIGRRNRDYTKWTGRDSSFMKRIKNFKSHGFYVMMKPHIWLGNPSAGKWRSDIQAKSPEGWKQWSEHYRKFILHFAKMSELYEVDLFCVGTELHQTVKDHPEYWQQLILDIRQVYSGQLTYAANWNEEITDVSFWDQLDYIGIQAYFPLTKKTQPSVKELKKGWKKHVPVIEALHKQFNKPVLFTEVGYKSTPDAGIEPWLWANGLSDLYKKACYKTQANCYEAFFQIFWEKDWFAGVHFWEWQAGHHHSQEKKNINFTPQNKPAENIMTKWFAKMAN